MDGPAMEHPIFVVGAPRSGVAPLQWALRQHPALWGGQETGFLGELLRNAHAAYRHGTRAETGQWLATAGVGWPEFVAALGQGVAVLFARHAEGRRWVDQTAGYVHHLDGLAALFPEAAFLHVQRDGRAAVDAMRRATEPMEHAAACRAWRVATEAGRDFAARMPTRIREVRYEELMANPGRELAAVYEFLGLEPAAASTMYLRNRHATGASRQPGWISTWTPAERREFHEVAGELLVELGYAADAAWVKVPTPI